MFKNHVIGAKDISIHALVKRATFNLRFCKIYCMISIHALVKRATDVINMSKYKYIISIHALVKRAT